MCHREFNPFFHKQTKCVCVTYYSVVFPQELVSHSMDRPERQQLKEALEAMQV